MAARATLRQKLLLAWGVSSLLVVVALGLVFSALLTSLHADRARTDIAIAFDLLSGRLRDDHRTVQAGAGALAAREDVIGALHLVSAFEDPANYAPYIFDVEKRQLAEGFADQARSIGLDLVTARDARLNLVAFYTGADPGSRTPEAGFITVIGGGRVPVGSARPLDELARIVDPPAVLDAFAPSVLPADTVVIHRFHRNRLVHEATAPVIRRLPGDSASVVGVITVARALNPRAVEEIIARTGLDIALVPGGAPAPPPFAGLDLSAIAEPLVNEADPAAPATAGDALASDALFVRAAWLPLADGRLNILIARRRSDLDTGLVAFRRAALLAVAGSMLVFVPVGGWILRRSVSDRLDRIAAGAEALLRGGQVRLDVDGPDDEVSRVARAIDSVSSGFAAREAQTRAGLERCRDLYDNAPVALLSVRAEDGRLLRFNRAFERLLGFAPEDLAGMRVAELYADTPYGLAAARRVFARFRAGEPVHDAELQMQRRDGQPLWVSITAEPVRDAAGAVVEGRSAIIDIDARKRTAESTGA